MTGRRRAAQQVRQDVDDMARRVQFVATHLVQVMARLDGAAGGDDGYPSGSSTGGGGNADLTPVEAAAARRIARRGQPDPATADLRRIEGYLDKASLHVWRLEQTVRRYTNVPPEPERRCTTCARLVPGATRRGLCPGCYQAWLRNGKPGEVTRK